MDELREKIARTIWSDGTGDEEGFEGLGAKHIVFKITDQILALIKEASYVKLAEDQSLPEAVLSVLGLRTVNATVKIYQREGWRKVEL